MLHELTLQPTYFEAIRNGTKRIECRLYDEKRQAIQLSDTLVFHLAIDPLTTLQATVIGLLRYQTFTNLPDDHPVEIFGAVDRQTLERTLNTFYSPLDQQRLGVLGIRIQI